MSVLSAASNAQAQSLPVSICIPPFCAPLARSAPAAALAYVDPAVKMPALRPKPRHRLTAPLPVPDPRNSGKGAVAENVRERKEELAASRACIAGAETHLKQHTASSKAQFTKACTGSSFFKPFADDAQTVVQMEGLQRIREGGDISATEKTVTDFASFNERFGAMRAPATARWSLDYRPR
jgi:hypothetical protein